ncbi:MAG TPA: hypothetical protein VEK33_11050 [Terriglobales bacterium]|nr:hypothetical protein [Terriglobales bacterium]
MLIPKRREARSQPMVAMALLGWLALAGCSVSVNDHDKGGNSKVDIDTPFGGIHVNEEADAKDTGLAVYPGARLKPKNGDGESKSANVNISSGLFGVKVVAIEYESDDAPPKILAFYREQLKKYGAVVECRGTHGADLNVKPGESGQRPVSCNDDNGGSTVELKTGTEDNQHLVSVEPEGKGCDFALVYIRTRGKREREGSI